MEEDAMLARFSRRVTLTLVGTVALAIAIASPAAAPPGDLDPTFDGDGKVTTDFAGSHDQAFGMALQGDGKIVAAGIAVVSGNDDFALARYNADGSLDTTFDGDGKVTTDFAGLDIVWAVAIQGDGKIVAAGVSGAYDFALARYNANGSLDTTFDGDGKVTTDFAGSSDFAFAVAIQGDGKIVAAGAAGDVVSGTNDFALARYNANGSLDTTFDGDGKVTTAFAGGHDQANAVAIQGDGKVLAGGRAVVSGTNDFALARYNADGSLDTTFSGDGKVTTDLAGGVDEANAVALQGDGKIVAAGLANVSGAFDFGLARYNADGSLDITFDGDGKVTTDLAGGTDQAFTVAIQGGKIVVTGGGVVSGGEDFALARYNSDGTLDTTFSGDGRVNTDFGSANEQARGVALQGDGKIVVAGFAFVSGANDFALARYQSQGTADLALTKTDPPGRAPTGRNMTYTLTVTNNGPDAASGVTVTDQLPPSVTFVSATPSQGSCSESGGIVTCSLGTLGNGATATVNIVVKPTTAGTITNTASVTAFDQDPNQGNNADSENTSVCRITSRRSSIPCG
jgi:uncharacterized delta-60 repeat protein/uncharacterized repeat protein (TIGR01451 family)